MNLYRYFFVFAAIGLAAPAYADNRWTQADVATYCHIHFGLDERTHGYKACLDRNKGKIGHDKTPGEQQELDAAAGADTQQ